MLLACDPPKQPAKTSSSSIHRRAPSLTEMLCKHNESVTYARRTGEDITVGGPTSKFPSPVFVVYLHSSRIVHLLETNRKLCSQSPLARKRATHFRLMPSYFLHSTYPTPQWELENILRSSNDIKTLSGLPMSGIREEVWNICYVTEGLTVSASRNN